YMVVNQNIYGQENYEKRTWRWVLQVLLLFYSLRNYIQDDLCINCFEKYCNKLMSFNLKNKKIKYMRLVFSLPSSENPEYAKNRRLKDFLEFKLLYSIGFIFYMGLYHSRLGDFFIDKFGYNFNV
ncbi:hypothetical protein, partial [Clostridium sp.]|uniref:hypothetical protein n=1 Tax=Clostridium sp. TaxID=1506 RepID=UPI002908670C